jgi:hypothetical protein
VLRAAKSFFISVVHSPSGVVGYVAAPELPSQEDRAPTVGHVEAPELPSQEGRARSYVTRGSTKAHLIKDARFGAEGHVAAPELTSSRKRGPGPRDT